MNIGTLVLSCEHGGNRVPPAYAALFTGARPRAALASHRGYDIGALEVAEALARRFDVELNAAMVTRLLVELNKSLGHRGLFSEFSQGLDRDARRQVLERYYLPHRQQLAEAIANAPARPVCHIGVHSFTPKLNGLMRQADIGLLYDPSRPRERGFCVQWQAQIKQLDPTLRVRRNYPYRGQADGLTTALRRDFAAADYLGIELETNQALLAGTKRRREHTIATLTDSLAAALQPA